MFLNRPQLYLALVILALLTTLSACGGGNDQGRFAFNLSVMGLPDSNTVFGHYEIWVVAGGRAISAGKFIVDGTGPSATVKSVNGLQIFGPASGATFGPSSTLLGEDFPFITAATHLFITVEPENDLDLLPSCQVLLAGAVVGRTAALTAAGTPVPAGFPCAQPDGSGGFFIGLGDFSGVAGSFQMMSPTDDISNPVNNDFAGVWFRTQSPALGQEGVPAADAPSLVLPELQGGLRYEAWATVDGVVRSLGRFTSPTGSDSDAMIALQRGPDSIGPRFPGGDFVTNFIPTNPIDPPALDLVTTANFMDGDYRTFVTIEPDIDNDTGPFQLEVLDAIIPPNATSQGRSVINVNMTSQFGNLPTAMVVMASTQVTVNNLQLQQLSTVAASDRRGHFQLWLDDGASVSSAGRFLVEGTMVRSLDTGNIFGDTTTAIFDSSTTGVTPFPDPLTATSCFITFENEGDIDAVPSKRVILQGNVSGGGATLTVAGDTANGGRGLEDFSNATGLFHLATPSDNLSGGTLNDNMGIQFRQRGVVLDFLAVGLTLPVLPSGWCYEGWVEDRLTGRVFSTGKFFDATKPDSDHSTSASEGTDMKFALPGKGFLFDVMVASRNAAQMGSITEVFITIESNPNNRTGPSDFRVLELDLTGGVTAPFIMQSVFPDSTSFRADMSYNEVQ